MGLLARDTSAVRYLVPESTAPDNDLTYNAVPSFRCAEWCLLNYLRRCANHPYLIVGVEPEPFKEGDHIIQSSSKLIVLARLIEHFRSRKERLLVFSGSTRMLDVVQDFLEWKCLLYERLDGSVRGSLRQASLERFSQPSVDGVSPDIFLLSTRAGGVGLNIVQASVVVFLDSDWNPHADEQALSRCFRQGQKKQVTVIRLVAQDTVDEVILERARMKMQLAKRALNEEMQKEDRVTLELLRKGVIELLRQDVNDAEKVSDAFSAEDPLVACLLKVNVEDLLKGASDHGVMRVNAATHKSDEDCQDKSIIRTPARGIYMFEGRDYRKLLARFASPTKTVPQTRRLLPARKPAIHHHVSYSLPSFSSPTFPSMHNVEWNDEGRVLHVEGDATMPLTGPPWVILHCVDASGRWPAAGFFGALQRRFGPQLRRYYESAKRAGDLHVGDTHLVPLKTEKDTEPQMWVALLVTEHNARLNKSQTATPMLCMETLKQSLLKLQQALIVEPRMSIHVPRFIGPLRDNEGRSLWYGVERLLEKYFAQQQHSVLIYYFNKHSTSDKRPAVAVNLEDEKSKKVKRFQSTDATTNTATVKGEEASDNWEPETPSPSTFQATDGKNKFGNIVQCKSGGAHPPADVHLDRPVKSESVTSEEAWTALRGIL